MGGNNPMARTPEGMFSDIFGRLDRLEGRVPKTPERLQPGGQQVTNWNDAIEDGFYFSNTGALNTPYNDQFVGYVQNQSVNGRLIQRLTLPFGNPNGNVEWVRAKSGTTWFGWARSDGRYTFTIPSGTTRFAGTGWYQLVAGSSSWFFTSMFANMPYRIFRITYRTQSPTAHRPMFRFLTTGTTQVSTNNYDSDDWSPAGHNVATNTALFLARDDAFEHSGEFTIMNPLETANSDNRKHGFGHDYSWPGSQTQWGMALSGYDTTALNGFVFYLSAGVISPNSLATISIQGLY